jgi:acyl-CoA thioester hydrolase
MARGDQQQEPRTAGPGAGVSNWIPTAQGAVNAWECDHMGHMNVQFYVGRIADGASHLRAALGMTPSVVRETGRAFVVTEHSMRYRRELRGGDLLRVEAGVLELAEKTMAVCYRLWNAATEEVAAISRSVVISVDLKARRSAPWAEDTRQRAETLRVDLEDAFPPYELPEVDGIETADLAGDRERGWIETYRGTANAWECDHLGHWNARFYLDRFAQAAFHLHSTLGMPPEWMRQNARGTAALMQHIRYRRELMSGDTMTVLSKPIAVTDRTIRHYNKLYNTATGALSATVDVLDIAIDRAARKAIALPTEVRAKAEAAI